MEFLAFLTPKYLQNQHFLGPKMTIREMFHTISWKALRIFAFRKSSEFSRMSSIRLHQLRNLRLDPMPIPLNTITVWLTFYAQFPLYKLTNIDSFKGIGENLTLFASLFILIELVSLISELFTECKNFKYFSRYRDKRKRNSLILSPIFTPKMAIFGVLLCNKT